MNSIPKGILISSGAVLVLLLGLNLWLWPNQALQKSPTSFGVSGAMAIKPHTICSPK